MKNVLIIAMSLLSATFVQAQYAGQASGGQGIGSTSNNAAAIASLDSALEGARSNTTDYRSDKFAGSPYVNNNFLPATLFYKDEKVSSIFYRHNALNEEIEIMKANVEGELIRSLAKDKNLNILINGKKMSFKTFVTAKKRTTNGYLTELIAGSEYDLFRRTHVKFTEGQPAQNSFVAAVPARFTPFTEYYFQKKGVNRIDQVLAKNNKLLKLLDSDKKTKVKDFLKENDLNIKEEGDLIKVFEFLNK